MDIAKISHLSFSSNAGSRETLFDAHAHYSFAPDVAAFAEWTTERLAGAFSTTVSPTDYLNAREVLALWTSIKVGLGAHPWWVSQGKIGVEDREQLEALATEERFIGEVGLDFGRNGLSNSAFATDEDTKQAQLEVLETILHTCQKHPDQSRVFSFHAVRGADVVMDLLEQYDLIRDNAIIFHWFSGSSGQLKRARELGCFFSVNSIMLSSKRGREYAKAIPAQQLLIETDLPEEKPEGAFEEVCNEYLAALEQVCNLLAELRGPEILDAVTENAMRIFA